MTRQIVADPKLEARAELIVELRVLRRLAMTEPSMEARAWRMIDQTLDALNQVNALGELAAGATMHDEDEA